MIGSCFGVMTLYSALPELEFEVLPYSLTHIQTYFRLTPLGRMTRFIETDIQSVIESNIAHIHTHIAQN